MNRSVLVDQLESRTLLSASLVGHGTLWVAGVADAANTITVSMSVDGALVVANVNGTETTFDKTLVKRIVIEGGSKVDTITIDTTNGSLSAKTGIYSHADNDVITLNNNSAFVSAGAGNDVITAGDGKNVIVGGAGNDRITTGNGRNIVLAGAGDDEVTTGDGDDTIIGLAGADTVTSGGGNDSIFARSGDTIDAGAGANTIYAPHNANPTLNNTGGGTDTVVYRRMRLLNGWRDGFVAGLALGRKLNAEV